MFRVHANHSWSCILIATHPLKILKTGNSIPPLNPKNFLTHQQISKNCSEILILNNVMSGVSGENYMKIGASYPRSNILCIKTQSRFFEKWYFLFPENAFSLWEHYPHFKILVPPLILSARGGDEAMITMFVFNVPGIMLHTFRKISLNFRCYLW